MYPPHLNYTTTLPCKTVSMKFTIFSIALALKSNKNMEVWHFRLSQLANCSKPCENSSFEDVFKVSTPSFHTNSKSWQSSVWHYWWSSVADYPILFARLYSAHRWYSCDIPVPAHAMSGFSFYRPWKLYPWYQQSINNCIYLICYKFMNLW